MWPLCGHQNSQGVNAWFIITYPIMFLDRLTGVTKHKPELTILKVKVVTYWAKFSGFIKPFISWMNSSMCHMILWSFTIGKLFLCVDIPFPLRALWKRGSTPDLFVWKDTGEEFRGGWTLQSYFICSRVYEALALSFCPTAVANEPHLP